MSLLHAEAMACLDALEARLAEMVAPDLGRGSITMLDPSAQCLAAVRSSIVAWHRTVYQPENPDDPRCVHGLDQRDCVRCVRGYLTLKG